MAEHATVVSVSSIADINQPHDSMPTGLKLHNAQDLLLRAPLSQYANTAALHKFTVALFVLTIASFFVINVCPHTCARSSALRPYDTRPPSWRLDVPKHVVARLLPA